jgi:hypothetical protein
MAVSRRLWMTNQVCATSQSSLSRPKAAHEPFGKQTLVDCEAKRQIVAMR